MDQKLMLFMMAKIVHKIKLNPNVFEFVCEITCEKNRHDFFRSLYYGMHSKIKLVDAEGILKEKSYSIVHKENNLISFIIKIYYPSEDN